MSDIKCIDVKLDECNDYYVFGAGKFSYYFVKWVSSTKRKMPKAIIVTEKSVQLFEDVIGIPIISIDEIFDRNSLVLITVSSCFWPGIEETLRTSDFINCYFVEDEILTQIRQSSQGSEFELCRDSALLQRKMDFLNTEFYKKLASIELMSLENRSCNDMYVGYDFDKRMYFDEYKKLILDEEAFINDVECLVRGLEESDKNTVFQIICRLRLLCEYEQIKYSAEEKNKIEQVEEYMNKHVFQITDNCFYFDNRKFIGGISEIPVFYYKHGLSLLKHPEKIHKKAIVDAGAYIGDSAYILASEFDSNIYSFDIEKENIDHVIKNTAEIANGSVHPELIALSDKVGECEFYSCDFMNSASSINEKSAIINVENTHKIKTTTIDYFAAQNHLTIGLIRTDVEGAEQQLLSGAVETLKKQKPTLIVSIYHSLDDFLHIKTWVEDLNLGYHFRIFRPILKGSFMAETVLICEADD